MSGFPTSMFRLVTATIVGLSVLVNSAHAQSNEIAATEYIERQNVDERMTAHGIGLLGDQIDMNTGSLQFSHVDISLPGNSSLEVAIRRKREQGFAFKHLETVTFVETAASGTLTYDFSDWQLDLPEISAIYPAHNFSNSRTSANLLPGPQICIEPTWGLTTFTIQPPPTGFGSTPPPIVLYFDAHEISNGVRLNIPGQGETQLLSVPTDDFWPNDTIMVTKDFWAISCIENDRGGDGLLARAPNGTTYRFDKLAFRPETAIPVSGESSPNSGGGGYGTNGPGNGQPQIPVTGPTLPGGLPDNPKRYFDVMGRTRVTWLVTEITDVHGNWVRYDYDNRNRVSRIHANDGREISIGRATDTGLITSISANNRTWQYQYQSFFGNQFLHRATLPDGRAWVFDNMQSMILTGEDEIGCTPDEGTVTLTHPDGIRGTFEVREKRHLTNSRRTTDCGADIDVRNVNWFQHASVVSKTLQGTGANASQYPAATWTYEYSGGEDTYDSSANEGQLNIPGNEKWTQMTDPLGNRMVSYYYPSHTASGSAPNGFSSPLEGLEYRSEYYAPGSSTPIQAVDTTYHVEAPLGRTYLLNDAQEKHTSPRHMKTSVLTRDGQSYTTETSYTLSRTNSAYAFGNPRSVKTYSELQPEIRETRMDYVHRPSNWVLGLPSRTIRNNKTFNTYAYDSLGQLTEHRKHGVLFGTFSWHSTGDQAGQLATHSDALGRTISLNNYYRGTPQMITRPDNVVLNRTVDDNGWLLSQTDARGNVFAYTYDDVGRVTQINRPGTLASTNIAYSGLGSGITQTSTTGNLQTTTNYDPMYRPFLTRQTGLNSGGNIYTRMGYDALNRQTFSSYPSTSSNISSGVYTTYDAIGRVIEAKEAPTASGTPFAVTTTAYTLGNRMTVTDPNGNQTLTISSGYGAPDDGDPIEIRQPEGVTTLMTYDVYGNLLTATQDGNTQTWDYDGRYRVCAHTTPETGTTRFQYTNADEVRAYAQGQVAGCGGLASADRIINTRDQLGRITHVNYPNGTEDTTMGYDNDGNLVSVSRGESDWTYAYDENGLLISENLAIDGRTYDASYQYDQNGYLTQYTSPAGNVFGYTNDGHGRASRVEQNGAYRAGSAQFFPNGQYKFIGTFAGLRYYSTQTSRQQALRRYVTSSTSSTNLMDLSYSYDANGLITSINDAIDGGEDRDFQYDGMNRLKEADGPWGNVAYTYDTRGNILSKSFTGGAFGTRTVGLDYNTADRLYRYRDTDTTNGSNRHVFYDARGNVTNNGRQTFEYDYANQPTAASLGGVTASFEYDGNYRRVKQTVNGETIYTVYGQSGSVLLRDNASTGEVTDYIRLGGKTIAELKNGELEFLFSDHLGTPIVGVSRFRDVLWRDSRTPFGEKMSPVAERSDRVGYTGHIEDEDLKLTYMQARYYDPVLGRFLSNDPMGFVEGGIAYHNRYAYTANDPINSVDPNGAQSQKLWPSNSELRAHRRSLEVRKSALDEQNKNINSAQTKAMVTVATTNSILLAGPAITSNNLLVSGGSSGAAISGVSNLMEQAEAGGSLDFVELGLNLAQGGGLGLLGGRFNQGATRATAASQNASLGRAAAVFTGGITLGGQVNGGFEALKAAWNGEDIATAWAHGVTIGILGAFGKGGGDTISDTAGDVAGATVEHFVEKALNE